MNVMKMVKDLMNVKIFTESTLMTPELKRQIKLHSDKLIDKFDIDSVNEEEVVVPVKNKGNKVKNNEVSINDSKPAGRELIKQKQAQLKKK